MVVVVATIRVVVDVVVAGRWAPELAPLHPAARMTAARADALAIARTRLTPLTLFP